jgi:hypothetical protein
MSEKLQAWIDAQKTVTVAEFNDIICDALKQSPDPRMQGADIGFDVDGTIIVSRSGAGYIYFFNITVKS